jgi:hypothetical protein
MLKPFVYIAVLATLAGCARTTAPHVPGYVPHDAYGRAVMSEIGKQFS